MIRRSSPSRPIGSRGKKKEIIAQHASRPRLPLVLTGTLEIRSVHGGIEEAGPHEIRAPEIGIPDDALLERHAPEVRPLEVGSVEIDAAGYRDRLEGNEIRGRERDRAGREKNASMIGVGVGVGGAGWGRMREG